MTDPILFHIVSCLRMADAEREGVRERGPLVENECCCCDQEVIAYEASLPPGRNIPICRQCAARLPQNPKDGLELLKAIAALRVEIERSN